jgi:hypothetical protein
MSLGTKLRRLGDTALVSSCLCLHRADGVHYEWGVKKIPSEQLPSAIYIPSPLQLIVFALLLLPVLNSSPPPSCDSVVASFISTNTHTSSLASLMDCASLQHPAAAFYLGMHHIKQGVQHLPNEANVVSFTEIQRLFSFSSQLLTGDHAAAAAAFLACYTSDGGR